MDKNKKFTFIDLFSGCGGFSEGLLQTKKFEALAHVEWEVPMIETLRNRLIKNWHHSGVEATKKVIHFDIQKTRELIYGNWSKETLDRYGKKNHPLVIKSGLKGVIGNRKVDIIIGGPPCQAYSIAGRAQDKNSMKNDYRNFLFESFVEVVKELSPKLFVFENVPGLLSACPGGQFVTERIYSAFNRIGYEIRNPVSLKKSIYIASELEVPQKRKRLIIFGVKKNSNINLDELYEALNDLKSSKNQLTVRTAIGQLPPLVPLEKCVNDKSKKISHKSNVGNNFKYHVPRYHNSRDIKLFKEWIIAKMNKKTGSEKISFYNKKIKKKSKHVKYRNLEWDKPSPTIVAHLSKDGLMFIHPDPKQARSITIFEASLLQSFPKDFEFIGTNAYCYKMIGNAVPPMMAKNIGLSILKTL